MDLKMNWGYYEEQDGFGPGWDLQEDPCVCGIELQIPFLSSAIL